MHKLTLPLIRGLLLIALLSLAACQTDSSGWRWQAAEGGLPQRIITQAVIAHPDEAAHLWAGHYTTNGLSTSTDGGQTWQAVGEAFGQTPVYDLLFVDRVLWAATGNGVFSSADKGQSWQQRSTAPLVFALAADAGGTVYAGLGKFGLLVRPAGTDTWQTLTDHPALSTVPVLSVSVSPNGQIIHAGTSGRGVFSSRDGGQTWRQAFEAAYAPNLAMDPNQPLSALASLRDRLAFTADGGQTWQVLPLAWTAEEVFSLLWLADGRIYAGTGGGHIYAGQIGEQEWTQGGQGIPDGVSVLDLAPARDRLLAGTWTGVYAASGHNQPWQQLSAAFGASAPLDLLTTGSGLLLASQDGLFRWQPEAEIWQPVAVDGPPGGVSTLAAAPEVGAWYAAMADRSLYRSPDGQQTWIDTQTDLVSRARRLLVDPTDPNHLYMLAVWERMYESKDGGLSWRAHWDGLGITTEAISLALDPADPDTVYLGSERGLHRSDQGGAAWQPVAPSLANQTILAIAVNPAPTGTSMVYMGATRGVYKSDDRGDTATQWGTGLEDISAMALLFHPQHPELVFAGTAYAGVYQSIDGGAHWQPIGPADLSAETIEAMAWGPSDDLFVITPYSIWRGVFDLDLAQMSSIEGQ